MGNSFSTSVESRDQIDHATSSCPLLDLPRELRDEIYSHLFDRENEVILYVQGRPTRYILGDFKLQGLIGNDREAFNSALASSTAVLRTCKQIRDEATSVFENSVRWTVHIEGLATDVMGSKIKEAEMAKLVRRRPRIYMMLDMPILQTSSLLSEVVTSLTKRNCAVVFQMLDKNSGQIDATTLSLPSSATPLVNDHLKDSAIALVESLGIVGIQELRYTTHPVLGER